MSDNACGHAVSLPSLSEWIVAVCAAVAALLVTLSIYSAHHGDLRRNTPCSAQRGLYKIITRLAPVMGLASFFGVVFPRSWEPAQILVHLYVSVAMWAFLELLLLAVYDLRGGVRGQGGHRGHSGFDVGLSFFLDPREYLDEVVAVLEKQPPLAFWSSPPLGCCFKCLPCLPCAKPARPSYTLIKFARKALMLYIVSNPFLPLLSMLAHEQAPARLTDALHSSILAAESAVAAVALYGLFIIYRVTHDPLHSLHTTLKFVAIKFVVLVAPLHQLVLSLTVHQMAKARWLGCVAQTAEAVVLALLLRRAYPAHELPHRTGGSDAGEEL